MLCHKTLPLPLGEGRGEGESPRTKAPSPYPPPRGEGFEAKPNKSRPPSSGPSLLWNRSANNSFGSPKNYLQSQNRDISIGFNSAVASRGGWFLTNDSLDRLPVELNDFENASALLVAASLDALLTFEAYCSRGLAQR